MATSGLGKLLVRRDCESHRGRFLAACGLVTGLFVVTSFVHIPAVVLMLITGTTLASVHVIYTLLGLVGLAAGVACWMMAARDLEKMRAGLMDPSGSALTQRVKFRITVLLVLDGLVLLSCLLILSLRLFLAR